MNWPALVVVYSFGLMLQPLWAIEIKMENGVVFQVPTELAQRLSIIDTERGPIAQGYSPSEKTLFLVTRANGGRFGSNIFKALEASGLLELLNQEGLQKPEFGLVGDLPFPESRIGAIYRISDEGIRDDQLVLFELRQDPQGTAVFALLGPQSEFYKLVPTFSEVVDSYDARSLKPAEVIDAKVLMMALAVFLINLAFVWYGFQKISQLREQGLEEQA